MKGWRKITVRGVTFTWRYGRHFVVVRREGAVFAKADLQSLTGRSWDTLERGLRKGTDDCAITPGGVARLIERKLGA